MARSKKNSDVDHNENKEIVNNKNPQDIEKKQKVQYKQLVLIIFMTVIMVMLSLVVSFSIVNMLDSTPKDKGHNSIITPNRPKPGDDDDDDDKDDDDDSDEDDKHNQVIFSYEYKDTIGNGILIKNMMPTLDEVGMNLSGEYYTFEFTLKFGKKSYNKYYEITAEKLDYTNLSGDYVKIYLETSDVGVSNVFKENGKVKVFNEYKNATIDKDNDNEKIIHSGYVSRLDANMKSRKFILKMWVSEDMPLVTENLGKTFAIRINVYAK